MDIGILIMAFTILLVFELLRVLVDAKRSTNYKIACVILTIIAIILNTKIYYSVDHVDSITKIEEAKERTRAAMNQINQDRPFAMNAEQDEICHEMENVIAAVEKFRASEDRLPKTFAELAAKSKLSRAYKIDYNIKKDEGHRHRRGFWFSPKFYELSCIDSEGNKFYYTDGIYDFIDSTPRLKIRWIGKIAIILQEEPELKPAQATKKVERRLEPIIPGAVHMDDK
jgi:hypothetical protein